MEGKRKFELPNGTVMFVRKPNVLDTQKADWEYSKVFNDAIRNGIPPRTMMLDTLRKSGIWTPEDEQLERVLRTSVQQQMVRLADLRTQDKVDVKQVGDVLSDVKVAREALMAHMQKLLSYLQHTAENKADDSRLYYLVSLCSEDANGKPVWASYDEFRRETDGEKLMACVSQFMLHQAGVEESLDEVLPENNVVLEDSQVEKPQ